MNKTKLSISTFGTILGIAGIEHGIGELLQGNIKPESMIFKSWPNNRLYDILAGEPAFTITTNLPLNIIGILAIIFSTLLVIWAIFFIQKKYGGLVLFGLIICQFLFGGGMAGPVLIGIIISLSSSMINSDLKWLKKQNLFIKVLKPIWKYVYPFSIISWFSMWPGLIILGMFKPLNESHGSIVYTMALLSFTSFLLTLFSAFSYDSSK